VNGRAATDVVGGRSTWWGEQLDDRIGQPSGDAGGVPSLSQDSGKHGYNRWGSDGRWEPHRYADRV
jgi:hypothetical protein